MTNGASQIPRETRAPVAASKPIARTRPSRLAIGVHSMPKTSEGNLKLWFILGGLILVLLSVIIFLALN